MGTIKRVKVVFSVVLFLYFYDYYNKTAISVLPGDDDVPSESQCRPYIEKALKDLESGDQPGECLL